MPPKRMTPVGVGLDLVDVARVVRLIERKGQRAFTRLLTPTERAYCLKQSSPAPHVAARLAAKEAVYKALQVGKGARAVGWRDIEVVRARDGAPSIALHGRGRKVADQLGVRSILISLSHTGHSAAAIVILLG